MTGSVLSDAHVAPAGSPPYRWHDAYRLDDSLARFERGVRRCVDEGADALLVPGDVTHEGDAWATTAIVEVLAASGRPAWIAGGNHDVRSGVELLPQAIERAGAGRVRGATPGGEAFGGVERRVVGRDGRRLGHGGRGGSGPAQLPVTNGRTNSSTSPSPTLG